MNDRDKIIAENKTEIQKLKDEINKITNTNQGLQKNLDEVQIVR